MLSPSASLRRFINQRSTGNKKTAAIPRIGTEEKTDPRFRHIFNEDEIDINSLVAGRPDNTFLIRVKGDSMSNANIRTGDVLIVDRSNEPADKTIVIAEINKKLLVKRLVMNGYNGIELHSENEKYGPIVLGANDELKIWGVVRSVIRTF